MRVHRLSAVIAILAGPAGCTTYGVALGPSRSRDVTGDAAGWGSAVEVGGTRSYSAGDLGIYLAAEEAAYDLGDGEALSWLASSFRYRRVLGAGNAVAPFVTVGGGPGYDSGYHPALVLEGHVEVGARIRCSDSLAVTTGVSERPLAFIGESSRAFNVVQLMVGVELTTDAARRR